MRVVLTIAPPPRGRWRRDLALFVGKSCKNWVSVQNGGMKTRSIFLLFAACGLNLHAEEAVVSEAEAVREHELLKIVWRVEAIDGKPVVEGSRTEFSFFEQGRVAATVGCNRIGGGVELGEGTLRFGPLMMTRMACEEALMDQENRFSAALSEVTLYRLEEEGTVLILLDEEEKTRVRLVKVVVTEVPAERAE